MLHIACAALMVFVLAPFASADEPAQGDGWRVLFDGSSLEGWEHVGPGGFDLEDGVLRTRGGMGLLWYTKETFGDCEIRVEYRTTSRSANSGVHVRIDGTPASPWHAVHRGYEIQICDTPDDLHATGSVYSLSPATARPAKPPGEWNTMIITLDGDIVRVAINGVEVNRFDPSQPLPERTKDYEPERGPRPHAGYIGLQNHDDYSDNTHVSFRSVAVRPLSRGEGR
jgi:hypothetical protein